MKWDIQEKKVIVVVYLNILSCVLWLGISTLTYSVVDGSQRRE